MASGSRTARYHGDGHRLSSSGSRHRGNWHDEYSPLWSEYLLGEKRNVKVIISYLKSPTIALANCEVRPYQDSQTFCEWCFRWPPP